MIKTTVYLPASLKRRLRRVAEQRGLSEAALIREGIDRLVESEARPRPRLPLFDSGDSTLAERVDEELARAFGR